MKSKVFIVPASGLIENQITEVNVSIEISSYVVNGLVIDENTEYFPKQIVIDNSSNGTIGYITLSDPKEYQIYTQHPEWFDFIPIRRKQMANLFTSPKTYKVLVKPMEPEIEYVQDLYIFCIGYVKS